MKLIVTGAAGFISSHLVDRLLGLGYRVVGIDNLSASKMENLREAPGNHHQNPKQPRTYQKQPPHPSTTNPRKTTTDIRQ